MTAALVHDWLTGMRGGEKALEVLCELLPDADLLTLVSVPGRVSPTIASHRIRTSLIQRLPLVARLYRHYLPLFPFAIEQFDLDDVDLVVSTSHCAAKAVVPRPGARHLCYCFTPMRYAWDQFDHYFGPDRIGPAASALARPVLAGLARWDRRTSGRVDRYVAISHYVAGRIRRYYNRQSDVVYPPVDTEFFQPDGRAPEGYLLIVSALVPYKRIDVAIDAARLAGLPLRIVGEGPEARPPPRRGGRRPGRVSGTHDRRPDRDRCTRARRPSSFQAKKTSASFRSKPRPVDAPWSRWPGEAPSRHYATG